MKHLKNSELKTALQVRQQIEQGIKDADAGNVKTWEEVKAKLQQKILNETGRKQNRSCLE